jgi:hypothetical protein
MTPPVYARNDIDSTTVSRDHGGCGATHARPRGSDGSRIQPWGVTCPACFTHLSKDPNFSVNLADLPETPDEAKNREDFEKRGAKDRDNVLAFALAQLAGVELPESLRLSVSGHMPAVRGMLVCAAGHDCEPGSRFCAECGSPVHQPAATAACPQGHEVAVSARFCPDCGSAVASPRAELEAPAPAPAPRAAKVSPAGPVQQGTARRKPLKDWRVDDLRALARERGVDDSGTRTDLLARLRPGRVPAAA